MTDMCICISILLLQCVSLE